MAFFGLTRLGEQNLFASNSRDRFGLDLFNDKEIEQAFDKTTQGLLTIQESEFEEFFRNLFLGPLVPESDVLKVKKQFAGIEVIDKENYISFIKELRERAKLTHAQCKASEHTSNTAYRESTNRNERLKFSPIDKYTFPITTNHDLGWEQQHFVHPMVGDKKNWRPRIASNETKYADAVATNGIF